MMNQLDTISTQYLTLAFALDQHVEGFVDAYFGPPDIPDQVCNATDPLPPALLVEDLAALRQQVQAAGNAQDTAYSAQRRAYLDKQLQAMETVARKLAGENITYRDEVRLLFDIEPRHVSEDVFTDAIADLEAVLPGNGPIAERMAARKQRYEVAPDVARQMIDRIAAEARQRTQALVALPADEGVEFSLVSDKPWSGYNWYLGGARSRVEINTDLPIRANILLDLVCHEAYPGHHTEHALKEQTLYAERGWGEQAVQLINTPECVIAEGIATLAADMIFGDDAERWMAAEIYPLGNIVADTEAQQRIGAAQAALRAVSGNAALLLHDEGADEDEVVRYLMRYGLRTEREARQQLRFISTPLWRAYTFTYHTGHDLLGRWIKRGDKIERFRTLLTEQIYPSLVEQWVLEEERNCLS